MVLYKALALAWLACAVHCQYMGKREPNRSYYTLNVPEGKSGQDAAKHVARSLGVRFEGQVGQLETYYMVSAPDSLKRDEDPVVSQFHSFKKLAKRHDDVWHRVSRLDKQIAKKRVKRGPIPMDPKSALLDAQKALGINDPEFPTQWHLINQHNRGNDINVTGVWKQGITGQGVTVVILDDGLDYNSKDLKDNFFAEGSYDFNDHESLPTPKLWDDNHGTRCAGQIAAVKNDVCGVGIAYDAKVAGVRILSGELTDADEALALNYEYQKNHIFSCSWGPPDNGETMEAPKGILADAFVNGIKKGRDGKGSIYVFATGNGAVSFDNCNFDGYTNSIYTITVGAIDHLEEHPPYSESCSAQLVVTYSSGNGEFIHTTNVGENDCSDRHGGTSAAAPNAAGIFALVLSVRPELTWRDLQYLCVQTAVPVKTSDSDWKKLPSGRIYNHKFGYGKLDAGALVEAAKDFKLVNQQTWVELSSPSKPIAIPDSSDVKTKKALKSALLVTADMVKAAGLLRLEHVTATVNIEHERRGNVVVNLESPNNVISELATKRNLDKSKDGIVNWRFMSVKHWEEDPVGNWTLNVYDVDHPEATGTFLNWTLSLFGEMDPDFKGTPIHTSTGQHDIKETSVTHVPTPTHTPTKDNTPSRPTKNKKPPTTTVSQSSSTDAKPSDTPITHENESELDSAKSGSDEALSETSSSASTVAYVIVGSISIFCLATALYFYKRKGWQVVSTDGQPSRQTRGDGYEFDVLQPLTGIDEESEEEDDDDDTHRHATR